MENHVNLFREFLFGCTIGVVACKSIGKVPNFDDVLSPDKVRESFFFKFLAATKQFYECPPVRLSHPFHYYVPVIVSSWNFHESLLLTKVMSMQKGQGQRSRSHGSKQISPQFGFSGSWLQFEVTDRYEMMHIAWSSIEEVPFSFSRPSVKF